MVFKPSSVTFQGPRGPKGDIGNPGIQGTPGLKVRIECIYVQGSRTVQSELRYMCVCTIRERRGNRVWQSLQMDLSFQPQEVLQEAKAIRQDNPGDSSFNTVHIEMFFIIVLSGFVLVQGDRGFPGPVGLMVGLLTFSYLEWRQVYSDCTSLVHNFRVQSVHRGKKANMDFLVVQWVPALVYY